MIAQAGLLSYRMGYKTPLSDSTCTQRSALYIKFLFSVLGSLFPDSGLTRCMLLGELRTKSHRDLADALSVYFGWTVCMNSEENSTLVSWVLGTNRPRDSELRTVVGKYVHGRDSGATI